MTEIDAGPEEQQLYQELLSDLEAGKLKLPTLPEVALQVRRIVDDPEASASDMAAVIATDPALSAQVLKVANSPMFPSTREIESIQRAVALLGVQLIRNIVTALMMRQLFHAKSSEVSLRMHALWQTNIDVAAYTQVMSMLYPQLSTDEAMLAGLIYNIGALPVLMRIDDSPRLASDPHLMDSLVERLSTKIGPKVLQQWQFPAELVEVAACYADLHRDSGEEVDLVDLVQVALLQTVAGTDHPLADADWDTIPAAVKLGLSEGIEEIELEGCTEKIEAAREMLNT